MFLISSSNSTSTSVCPSMCLSVCLLVCPEKSHFLKSYHKMSLIKVAWCVSSMKNMHPGSSSDPSWTTAEQGKTKLRILNFTCRTAAMRRVAQNFKHEKFIWDQADSYSLRKRNAEKCENYQNWTTFRYAN